MAFPRWNSDEFFMKKFIKQNKKCSVSLSCFRRQWSNYFWGDFLTRPHDMYSWSRDHKHRLHPLSLGKWEESGWVTPCSWCEINSHSISNAHLFIIKTNALKGNGFSDSVIPSAEGDWQSFWGSYSGKTLWDVVQRCTYRTDAGPGRDWPLPRECCSGRWSTGWSTCRRAGRWKPSRPARPAWTGRSAWWTATEKESRENTCHPLGKKNLLFTVCDIGGVRCCRYDPGEGCGMGNRRDAEG